MVRDTPGDRFVPKAEIQAADDNFGFPTLAEIRNRSRVGPEVIKSEHSAPMDLPSGTV